MQYKLIAGMGHHHPDHFLIPLLAPKGNRQDLVWVYAAHNLTRLVAKVASISILDSRIRVA